MLVDLVQVITRDGLRLDGIYQPAPPATASAIALDAVCFVHGTGGNFYNSSLFDYLAQRFLDLGCAVLRVNTRGHDGISTAVTAGGGRRLGAAYEVIDDCRHDLTAWLEWLCQRAGSRLGLMGHSMGAVKCLYASIHEPYPSVVCIIALSPPILSYSRFCSSSHRQEFLDDYARAEGCGAAGQPTTLLEVKFPLPFTIAAASYLEKYGPEERYNYLRFIAGVPCSTLVTVGSLEAENHVAFRGTMEELEPLATRQPLLSTGIIPRADHFYTGTRTEIGSRVENWLRETLR